MFSCCGISQKGFFRHIFLKPYFRCIEYGVCQNCGKEIFIDFRQYAPGKEVKKEYKKESAKKQYDYWNNRLAKTYQGTPSKEHFYFGYHVKDKKGYYKTYRMNFNNKKEFLFSQKFP